MPFIAISVGLAVGKEMVGAIVYNPITEELFTAQKDQKARLTTNPWTGEQKTTFITVSKAQELKEGTISTSMGIHNFTIRNKYSPDEAKKYMETYLHNHKVMAEANGVQGHRQLGSTVYTMMYVAQGKLASYLGYSIYVWDIAAASLIVKSAGGHLIDPTGNEFNLFSRKILCAGTEKYAQNMVAKFEVFDFESELAQDKDVNNNHGTMNSSNNGK